MAEEIRQTTAIARQTLAVGGPAEVGFDKTALGYIPGSALRGALAAAWRAEYGDPAPSNPRRGEFIDLFEGAVRYGPLLQDGSQVVPISALWCKYPKDDSCAGWSADAAYDGSASRCEVCHQGVVSGKGEIDGAQATRVVRSALDETGRAKQGSLRGRSELAKGIYRGRITGWHHWLSEPHEVFIGGQRSISGLTEIHIEKTPSPLPVPDPTEALVIRLESPAILVDDAGRPRIGLVGEICRLLGLIKDDTYFKEWVRPVKVGGWHAASGLPKPAEYAVAMGSTIRLETDRDIDPEAIKALATHGMGLRRTEGFGTVQINPPAWRKAQAGPTQVTAEPSILAGLEELRLLEKSKTVAWLLDRARLVVFERQRPGFRPESLMLERVAFYFDDRQAAAVLSLFKDERLPAALPLLERELERLRIAEGSGRRR